MLKVTKAINEKKIYEIQEVGDPQSPKMEGPSSFRRTATIIFENGKFHTCKYELSSDSFYNLEDWEFLAIVSKEIVKLAKMSGEKKC